jgi:hypothetical protein
MGREVNLRSLVRFLRKYHLNGRSHQPISTQSHLEEDLQLSKFLETKGLIVKRPAWNDLQIDWKQFDVVILESPWDYHDNFGSFILWLSELDTAGISVLNHFQVMARNVCELLQILVRKMKAFIGF